MQFIAVRNLENLRLNKINLIQVESDWHLNSQGQALSVPVDPDLKLIFPPLDSISLMRFTQTLINSKMWHALLSRSLIFQIGMDYDDDKRSQIIEGLNIKNTVSKLALDTRLPW